MSMRESDSETIRLASSASGEDVNKNRDEINTVGMRKYMDIRENFVEFCNILPLFKQWLPSCYLSSRRKEF